MLISPFIYHHNLPGQFIYSMIAPSRYPTIQEVNLFIIVMGVSGCGKTTIGEALAAQLGWRFYDGDHYHPPANIAKMASGIPLNDADRAGWLDALAAILREGLAKGESGVMACSALKEKYRRVLRVDAERVKFVYLKGSYELILERMQSRDAHYMKPEMLRSQFEALEEPQGVLTEDVSRPPGEIVRDILEAIQNSRSSKAKF